MADPTEEEVKKGVEAGAKIGAEAGSAALKAQGVTKKKKKETPGLWETGKALYKAYMARRKKMPEIGLPPGGIRKKKPKKPPPTAPPIPKPVAFTPSKKEPKENCGGVGGVLDAIQERKRRQREAYGEEE